MTISGLKVIKYFGDDGNATGFYMTTINSNPIAITTSPHSQMALFDSIIKTLIAK